MWRSPFHVIKRLAPTSTVRGDVEILNQIIIIIEMEEEVCRPRYGLI
ncbi:hypothetical protein [Aminobacterium colombiense]|jgi:hypothetical protein|uniref:Uncharacterized protein n=1 Tax=Aminobacterium colombiense (strain DSM 12261 / ALA-1) TaxID=572547 RepID=D5EE17_AMICL|nr:hypothetical protein Amico_0664 [Aminobacterium colombiense DSM 12261]MDD2378653.1 hypothetical protein [Aminobacterium colombiense]